ncbi:MAG: alkaline shock response membrane anchor protein AmaP [Clostridia bacterium]|nr:alkaline shock response membrane anchor protein AmaP [Clostridia bacterium]
MKWFDRILLVILAVMGAVCGFCLISVAIGWPLSENALRGIAALAQETPVRWFLGITSLIALLICARLLYIAIKRSGDYKRTSVVVETTDNGQTLLSYNAIVAMTMRHVKANRYVNGCKVEVNCNSGALVITVRISVAAEASVAELTRELQASVKELVETSGGVSVAGVNVLVESTASVPAPRVE